MTDSRAEQALTPFFGLRNKTAVVTGAGSGIGRATAALFAAVGANVVVAGRHDASIRTVADEIVADGGSAIPVVLDIADETAVRSAFAEAVRAFGSVDVLVNNAAYRPKADFMEMSVDQWDHMHNVNTRGTFLCMREAIRQMRMAGKGGSIVNVSTISSLRPVVFSNTHYDSSKAGVNAMTRTAALEFAADRIRINAVLPGATDTEAARTIKASGRVSSGPMSDPGRHPMGRRADPAELARAILFLASPAASFITGQLLIVDGGFALS